MGHHAPAPARPRCADIAPDLAASYRLAVDMPAPPAAPLARVISEIVRWTPSPALSVLARLDPLDKRRVWASYAALSRSA